MQPKNIKKDLSKIIKLIEDDLEIKTIDDKIEFKINKDEFHYFFKEFKINEIKIIFKSFKNLFKMEDIFNQLVDIFLKGIIDINKYPEKICLKIELDYLVGNKWEFELTKNKIDSEKVIEFLLEKVKNLEEKVESLEKKQKEQANLIIGDSFFENPKEIIYNVTSITKQTDIFGDEFVKNNKEISYLIIDNKKVNLCAKFRFSATGNQTVKLIEKQPINNMEFIFYRCNSIASLESFKNWDVSHVVNMFAFFNFCEMTTLNGIENWNVSNVKNLGFFVAGCKSLKNIEALRKWDVRNVTSLKKMFCLCSSLTNLEPINNWRIDNVKDKTDIFNLMNSEGIKTASYKFL